MSKYSPTFFDVVLRSAFIIILTGLLSCNSDNGTGTATVTVKHDTSNLASGIDHVNYIAYDQNGNKTFVSPDYPLTDLHVLWDVPLNSTTIVTDFHTSTEESLNTDTLLVSFADKASLTPHYHGPAFDPKRLALVDSNNGSLLVRGNLPLVANNATNPCFAGQDHCFAAEELGTRMKEIVPGFDITEFEIIDFTLIDNQGTKDELTAEVNAVGKGLDDIACGTTWLPFNGCSWDPKSLYTATADGNIPWGFIWWPVYACGNRPCNDADTKTGLEDFRFNEASEYLKQLLTTPTNSGKSRLVYFHCVQGTDRTGALHIAYMLDSNPQMTFAEAVKRATIGARQGSEDQQLFPALKPMCTYVGLAYRYCLEKNPQNTERCEMPGGFGNDATLCR